MSDLRSVMKGGWHPKGKEGGKESWRGDFKGINQVAGWMGKGKKPGSGDDGGSGHMSRPLASLKDPSLFGPPPKNVNYHGGAALPNEITPHTGGLGAPLTKQEVESAERAVRQSSEEQTEEELVPAGPPLPYRADRTGLKTDHLPPPPVHRSLNSNPEEQVPPSRASPKSKPKPGLPPRLPARQNSSNVSLPIPSPQPPVYQSATEEPKPANTWLNPNATNRLAKAGVSVSSLGIGESNPWRNERAQVPAANTPQAAPSTTAPKNMSELQARFSRMTSPTPKAQPQPENSPTLSTLQALQPPVSTPPTEGTTLAQKQAAFQTAQNFHRDPSSVTLADAQSAAATANNFRERHQDQIAAGATRANSWNKKYNVAGRVSNFLEKQASPVTEQPPGTPPAGVPGQIPAPIVASPPLAGEMTASIARKPPPPPPPKKPAGMHAPPPVPIGTKPSFG